MELDALTAELIAAHPGHGAYIDNLVTLLVAAPPPFLLVHDHASTRLTAHLTRRVLRSIQNSPPLPGYHPIRVATLNAVACVQPRIVYDTVLNALAEGCSSWEQGSLNWPHSDESDIRWNDSFDGFLAGIRAISSKYSAKPNNLPPRLVIIIENAERLKDNVPSIFQPLTNLQELATVPITTLLVSMLEWPQFRPYLGVSPDPLTLTVDPRTTEDMSAYLCSLYASVCVRQWTSEGKPSPLFDARMQPLYANFIEHLLHTCLAFTRDPVELGYLAAANWPRFLQPWLKALQLQAESSSPSRPGRGPEISMDEGEDVDMEDEVDAVPQYELPDDKARMKLLTSFRDSFKGSVDTLYPRISTSTLWAKIPHGLDPKQQAEVTRHGDTLRNEQRLIHLQGLARWVALASFFASYNPPRTDQRLFYRGSTDERRKKKGGGTRKTTASRKAKMQPKLIGPSPFPLERMQAILGALLAEHDEAADGSNSNVDHPDVEVERVSVLSGFTELIHMGLIERAADKSGVPQYKCLLLHEDMEYIAKKLDMHIKLAELLWYEM